MALARDEVADGHERRLPGGRAALAGRSVPRWTTRVRARPERAARALDARAVGEHEPRARADAGAHRPRARAEPGAGVEHVAAVDGDDERRAGDPRAADGVAGGNGVVRVDEVERERAPQAAQREPRATARPRRPSSP